MAKTISDDAHIALRIARDEAIVIVDHNLRLVQLHTAFDDPTRLHEASANVHYYAGIRDLLNLMIADLVSPKMRDFMQTLDKHYDLRENG